MINKIKLNVLNNPVVIYPGGKILTDMDLKFLDYILSGISSSFRLEKYKYDSNNWENTVKFFTYLDNNLLPDFIEVITPLSQYREDEIIDNIPPGVLF